MVVARLTDKLSVSVDLEQLYQVIKWDQVVLARLMDLHIL